MSTLTENYSLASKFKFLIYLTIKNDTRSINLVRSFATDINVLYVTADSTNIDQVYHPNIEIYDFKTILGGLSRINLHLNIIKLIQKIESICKSENIIHKKLLFISNNLRYTQLLTHFSKATLHFDFSLDAGYTLSEKLMEKSLYLRTNSITTTTVKQKKQFEHIFKSSFRVPDGIEHNLTPILKDFTKNDSTIIGCYTSKPEFLNYDLISKIAQRYPSYIFYFLSDEDFSIVETPDNVFLGSSLNGNIHYDLILLPVDKNHYEYLNQVFYENLCYLTPIIALKTVDLDIHKQLIKTYISEHDLIESLGDLSQFRGNCSLQKDILLQNCSWNSRAKQIESVILS